MPSGSIITASKNGLCGKAARVSSTAMQTPNGSAQKTVMLPKNRLLRIDWSGVVPKMA